MDSPECPTYCWQSIRYQLANSWSSWHWAPRVFHIWHQLVETTHIENHFLGQHTYKDRRWPKTFWREMDIGWEDCSTFGLYLPSPNLSVLAALKYYLHLWERLLIIYHEQGNRELPKGIIILYIASRIRKKNQGTIMNLIFNDNSDTLAIRRCDCL